MNERIRELMYQAAEFTAAYPSGQNNSWETQVNFMEKFAQLIVRECLVKIENEAAQYAEPAWAFELANDIRDHFGVEP